MAMVSHRLYCLSVIAFSFAMLCVRADENATLGWFPGEGIRGMDGKVISSILWDRDGAGGNDPVLVIGGNFQVAGETLANYVAIWNGTGWEALGEGVSGEVHSFAVLPNGDLAVGGNFVWAGGDQFVRAVARWDGANWHGFGTGMGTSSWVYALAVLPNGDLVAGGSFTTAGEVDASGIARWNGEAWSAFGSGIAGSGGRIIYDMAVLPNEKLVIAGTFSSIDGNAITSIASWDGETWSALGEGATGIVNDLALFPNGNLAVAGGFSVTGIGTIRNVAIWDGEAWSSIGSNAFGQHLGGNIFEIAILPDESIVAGGAFWSGNGAPADFVARWNGEAWEPFGTGTNNFVNTVIVMPDGDLVAGGTFLFADETHASRIARWDGNGWRYFGSGFGGTNTGSLVDTVIYDFLTLPNGDVIAGGAFRAAGSVSTENVALWNGSSWSATGDGPNGDVRALALLPDNRVLAAGAFNLVGGQAAKGLAVWDGSVWAPFADLLDGLSNPTLRALLVLPDGGIVVGGQFFDTVGEGNVTNIALWKDDAWHPLGTSLNGSVNALARLSNGDIVAGGDFTRAGTENMLRVARWDGTAWQAMGAGMNGTVNAFDFLPNGNLLAAGRHSSAGGVQTRGLGVWDGADWSGFAPSGYSTNLTGLQAVQVLNNGSVLIGGYLGVTSDPPGKGIALWDGQSWSSFGTGADVGLSPAVYALEPYGNNGGFLMGGSFTTVNDEVSAHFAQWGVLSGGGIASLPVRVRASRTGNTLTVNFEAAEEEIYCVQFSTSLISWQTLLDDQSGNTEYVETDPQRLTLPRIFYRAFRD